MSNKPRQREERTWVPFVGDFVILKKFFAQKDGPIWHAVQLFDALLRGFGQVSNKSNVIPAQYRIISAISLKFFSKKEGNKKK